MECNTERLGIYPNFTHLHTVHHNSRLAGILYEDQKSRQRQDRKKEKKKHRDRRSLIADSTLTGFWKSQGKEALLDEGEGAAKERVVRRGGYAKPVDNTHHANNTTKTIETGTERPAFY